MESYPNGTWHVGCATRWLGMEHKCHGCRTSNDLGDAEEVIADLEKKLAGSDDNSKQIIGIEKDIEYMKNSLGRIESMVTRKNK